MILPEEGRSAVTARLSAALPGRNLYDIAADYGVTVFKNGLLNKGWAGITLERVAELHAGNAQRRDGIDFELKSTTLVRDGSGWKPKETIKVTQMNPKALLEETFETSALWDKLERLILVGLHHESPGRCSVVRVAAVNVTDPELVAGLRSFWEEVRQTLSLGEMADHLSSRATSGGFLQLRPTGDGKQICTCPVTGRLFPARAFYATKRFIARVLELP